MNSARHFFSAEPPAELGFVETMIADLLAIQDEQGDLQAIAFAQVLIGLDIDGDNLETEFGGKGREALPHILTEMAVGNMVEMYLHHAGSIAKNGEAGVRAPWALGAHVGH